MSATASKTEVVLGIDLGTTYSVAGTMLGERLEMVLDNGDPSVPSVVHVPQRGAPIVGRSAQLKMATEPMRTVGSIKRLLGRSNTDPEVRGLDAGVGYRIKAGARGRAVLDIDGSEIAPEQIAAAILSHLRGLAERRFGCAVRSVVLGVPAMCHAGYIAALRRAARLAHVEILQVVPEPIAGALAAGLHAQPANRRIAVCDFGGGTYDVSLLEQEGTVFRPVATGGDPFLGGDDFDDAFADAIAGQVFRRCKFDMRRDAIRWASLRMRCESIKRVLSRVESAQLVVPDAYVERGTRMDIDVVVDRPWLEPLWRRLVARAVTETTAQLQHAGWQPSEVDEVILIGGTCNIPLVKQRIAELFDRTHLRVTDEAGLAVVTGVTLQSGAYARVATTGPQLAKQRQRDAS